VVDDVSEEAALTALRLVEHLAEGARCDEVRWIALEHVRTSLGRSRPAARCSSRHDGNGCVSYRH